MPMRRLLGTMKGSNNTMMYLSDDMTEQELLDTAEQQRETKVADKDPLAIIRDYWSWSNNA
jgi:hypothetical protein